MAHNLRSNGPSRGSNVALEKPFFDRLVEIERQISALREDRKQVCIEAKEVDVPTMPLKLSVKLYLESEKARNARLNREAEAERILRALGEFVHTELGQAAMQVTEQLVTEQL